MHESVFKVEILNRSRHPLPAYQTAGASGFDFHALLDTPVVLRPMEFAFIPTGLFMAIPAGFELQIRPRSGLATKYGLTLPNSPATVDSDYRGEIRICLVNLGKQDFEITDGMRIAQGVLVRTHRIVWQEVDQLTATPRNTNGFGHTGL
jgi:dUTP pyrophosphatase